MGKLVVLSLTLLGALALALGAGVAVVSGALGLGGAGLPPAAGPGPGGPAVPADWELLDHEATAAECPGLDWSVLAAIGRLESDSGRSDLPGVHAGANPAGAEGPMQFEPATFAAYATTGPGGATPPDPWDPVDAVYTAARLLCADGAGTPSGLAAAVFDYDHSTVYVDTVLVLAAALDDDPGTGAVPATALAFSAAQLGDPYLWGGTGPGAWDCSGLVQAAYRAAGVPLPRVAQDQFGAGPPVPAAAVAPGDLVFFGDSPTTVTHVGIYVGGGQMIDAPHTGAVVRIEPVWRSELVGVTRPGG